MVIGEIAAAGIVRLPTYWRGHDAYRNFERLQRERIPYVFTSSTAPTTLNSFGYSPYPLSTYLNWIEDILIKSPNTPNKPFIISITSSTLDPLYTMISLIQALRHRPHPSLPSIPRWQDRIAIELNTSCPNIPLAPPPAYEPSSPPLTDLLAVLAEEYGKDESLTIGLKLPPYLYEGQFQEIISVIEQFSFDGPDGRRRNPFAFFTCTNTLGNSLLFNSQLSPDMLRSPLAFALPTPLGGLAGESLHPLALGNVYTFSRLLAASADEAVRGIVLIGVGGVSDVQGVRRMRSAGASIVGAASAFGKHGVAVFQLMSDEVR